MKRMDVTPLVRCLFLPLLLSKIHALTYKRVGASLNFFPNNIQNDTERVLLGYNHLRTIPNGTLAGKTLLYEINLGFNEFKKFPELCDVGSSLKILYIDDNFLTEIKESDISCLERLETLALSRNDFYTFPDLSAVGSSLTVLAVSYFRGDEIPVNILSQLTELTKLRLSYCRLTIDRIRDLGINSSKMEMLYLGGNNLSDIPSDVFGQFEGLSVLHFIGNRFTGAPKVNNISANLSSLDLADTRIGNPPGDYFNGLSMLRRLSLNSCNLTIWPIALNDVAGTLINLDISYNQITTISNLIRFPNLLFLKAVANPIVSISSLADSIGPNINQLSLGVAEPLLDHVFAGTFLNLKHLRLHSFQGNSTGFPKVGSMPKLDKLVLYNNNIERVPVGALKGTPQLRSLHLENNRLSTLYDLSQHTPRLLELYLHGNALVCDCKLQWLQGFATRGAVILTGSGDSRICSQPPALASRNLIGDIPKEDICKGQATWYKFDYTEQSSLNVTSQKTVHNLDDCAILCLLDQRCDGFEIDMEEIHCTLKFKDLGANYINYLTPWKLYRLDEIL